MIANGSDVDLISSNGTDDVIECTGAVPFSADLIKREYILVSVPQILLF
jgi:hypothetical protein